MRSTKLLRAPGLEIQLLENRGVQMDTVPLQRVLPTAYRGQTLTVVLEGEYETAGAGAVPPGTVVHEERDVWLERWSGSQQRFLSVEWAPTSTPRVNQERLGPKSRRAWDDLARQIATGEPDWSLVLRLVMGLARSLGLTLPQIDAVVPPAVRRIVPALRHAFTHLHEQPQWVDLEARTGLSARQLRRAYTEHPEWLGRFGFRGELKWRRLQLALSMLDSELPGARVARALGYHSDRSMYTALRRAGLGRSA